MDEKGKRKGDFYEEEPTTFEIHPDDVMVVPDDSDIEWLDQDFPNRNTAGRLCSSGFFFFQLT